MEIKPYREQQCISLVFTGIHNKKSKKSIIKFKEFIIAFGDNRGQKQAYKKSWCKIPDFTDELTEKIIEGAKRYALERQNILDKGGTPKMAQSWLASRQWENKILK